MNMDLVKRHLGLLGLPVTDKVTGLSGVVTTVTFDLYGCIQALVHPGIDEKGVMRDQAWFDVARLTAQSQWPVMEPPDYEYGPQAEARQGAAEKPPYRKA